MALDRGRPCDGGGGADGINGTCCWDEDVDDEAGFCGRLLALVLAVPWLPVDMASVGGCCRRRCVAV